VLAVVRSVAVASAARVPRTVHHAHAAGVSEIARQAAATPMTSRVSSLISAAYQAWLVPQCGQPTEVVTSALNAKPQWHEYSA
jgi:hypothetical protein